MMKREIFRIIDANLNRSREGLRVCEEMARFILNSKPLTTEFKSIRHKISEEARRIEKVSGVLFDSRNSEEDVGRASKLPGGISRIDAGDIFTANLERTKEGLRVLEEFAKLFDKKVSARFSELRFKVYDIESRCASKVKRLRNFK